MRLLLDTHAFLWFIIGRNKLRDRARDPRLSGLSSSRYLVRG